MARKCLYHSDLVSGGFLFVLIADQGKQQCTFVNLVRNS